MEDSSILHTPNQAKKNLLFLTIGLISTIVFLNVILVLETDVLSAVPLIPRMILYFPVYWLWAIVPIILMKLQRVSLKEIGFSKAKTGLQIAIGIALGVFLSLLITVLPTVFNLWEASKSYYTEWWQFSFELAYHTIAVGAVEEIVFRCFFYLNIRNLFGKEWLAIIISSVLFGIIHVFIGGWFNVAIATCIGLLFCFARYKYKNCTTASLIIAHGVNNFLAVFWPFIAAKIGIF